MQLNSQKLRLILAQAEAKYDAGTPLTVKEETLLGELWNRQNEQRRTKVVYEDDAVHISETINVEPIFEAMRAYGDFINRYAEDTGKRMVGAIDPVTAAIWAKETGLAVGTKEFAQFAIKRIKDDIDYRNFRVGG